MDLSPRFALLSSTAIALAACGGKDAGSDGAPSGPRPLAELVAPGGPTLFGPYKELRWGMTQAEIDQAHMKDASVGELASDCSLSLDVSERVGLYALRASCEPKTTRDLRALWGEPEEKGGAMRWRSATGDLFVEARAERDLIDETKFTGRMQVELRPWNEPDVWFGSEPGALTFAKKPLLGLHAQELAQVLSKALDGEGTSTRSTYFPSLPGESRTLGPSFEVELYPDPSGVVSKWTFEYVGRRAGDVAMALRQRWGKPTSGDRGFMRWDDGKRSYSTDFDGDRLRVTAELRIDDY